jgi:hypothetical protein
MEIKIDDKYRSFWSRFKRAYTNYFWVVTLASLLSYAFGNRNWSYAIAYFALLIAGSLYCLAFTRSVLYKIMLDELNQVVIVEILRYNKVKDRHEIDRQDFKVDIRRNFISRYKPWVVILFEKNRIIFKQQEVYGWSHDDFSSIQKMLIRDK